MDRYFWQSVAGAWLLVAGVFLLLFAFADAAWGQDTMSVQMDTLTVEVEGYALVAGIAHDCPIDPDGRVQLRGYEGTTFSCSVQVIGTDSLPTPGTIEVIEADTTIVRVEIIGDSILNATILRRGNAFIRLRAVPILLLALVDFSTDPWSYDTIPPFSFPQYQERLACAYFGPGYREARAVGMAPAQTLPCPIWQADPLPTFPVQWTETDEQPAILLPQVQLALVDRSD